MLSRTLLACLVIALLGIPAAAGTPVKSEDSRSSSPASSPGNNAALAGPLRELLVQNLPTPLYEANWDWGRTAHVTTGIKWTGKGLNAHPQAAKGDRNDGTWRKVRITAENLPRDLAGEPRNVQHL